MLSRGRRILIEKSPARLTDWLLLRAPFEMYRQDLEQIIKDYKV